MGLPLIQLGMHKLLVLTIFSVIIIKLVHFAFKRRQSHLADIKGPPSKSFFLGILEELFYSVDALDRWANEYGRVIKVPTGLGNNRVMLYDPKAVAHVLSNDGFSYLRPTSTKIISKSLMGHNMVSSDKEDHRRQRRAMALAFTNTNLRGTTSVFYDCVYKVKSIWDELFESGDEVIIDVQQWINKITLDSIGIAGFGHDFKSIEGHISPVSEALNTLVYDTDPSKAVRRFVLATFVPQILNLPLKSMENLRRMKNAFSEIATELLANARKESEASDTVKDRSILGLILKGRSKDANFQLLQEEVVGQVVRDRALLHLYLCTTTHCTDRQGLFLFAGYDTTTISFCWALVELARHPEVQDRLREELRQLSSTDPTWEQLTSGQELGYLDAVVHESLRLHPPLATLDRDADKDDTIPLSSPITTASGQVLDSLFVPKGTTVILPFSYLNRSEEFWGPDAQQFIPERWLKEDNHMRLKEISGYKHIYSFSDGPRICLGRTFALAEFKAVLSVLVRNFCFELPSGPETKITIFKSLVPRPSVAGEVGGAIPMRVRQVTC